MTQKLNIEIFLPALVLGLLFVASAAPLAAETGSGHVELYLGIYEPTAEVLESGSTLGLRAGYQLRERLGLELEVGRYTTSEVFPLPDRQGNPIDVDRSFIDFSLKWLLRDSSRSELFVFAGPGYTFTDLAASGSTGPFDSIADDTLTLHGGAGFRYLLTERFYVRPDARVRWLQDNGDLDFEASVALGLIFPK